MAVLQSKTPIMLSYKNVQIPQPSYKIKRIDGASFEEQREKLGKCHLGGQQVTRNF